mgnify:CR=1 FL=1
MGDAFYATAPRGGSLHPPEREDAEPGLLYDSVVALPGPMPGAPWDVQHHDEYGARPWTFQLAGDGKTLTLSLHSRHLIPDHLAQFALQRGALANKQ